MYNSEDIFARLQNGETVEDIAQEMSDALNEAKELQKEAAKREEEEKAAEVARIEKVNAEKVRIAERIVDDMCDYAALTRNDDLLKAIREIEPKEVAKLLDEMAVMYKKLDRLKELEFHLPKVEDKSIFGLWDGIFR